MLLFSQQNRSIFITMPVVKLTKKVTLKGATPRDELERNMAVSTNTASSARTGKSEKSDEFL